MVEVVAVEVLLVVGRAFELRPGLSGIQPHVLVVKERRCKVDEGIAHRKPVERAACERETVDAVEFVTEEPDVALRINTIVELIAGREQRRQFTHGLIQSGYRQVLRKDDDSVYWGSPRSMITAVPAVQRCFLSSLLGTVTVCRVRRGYGWVWPSW